MLEKYFKEISEKIAKPFISILSYFNIKPNTVSLVGLFIVIFGSLSFYYQNNNVGIILIFLGNAVDGLDGPYARKINLQSQTGALLDSFIDRISELFVWSVVAISYTKNEFELFTILSVVVSSNLIPYLRSKSEFYKLINKKGITARPERIIFAVIFMYFNIHFIYMYIFAILSWITVFQRFNYLYQHLN